MRRAMDDKLVEAKSLRIPIRGYECGQAKHHAPVMLVTNPYKGL